ncbi:MAG TPA: hypothetical protein VGJ83_04810 [Gemmatimonadales bacterium]
MKATRLSLSVLLGGAVLVALSCAEPTAPAPRGLLGGDDLFGDLKQLTGLLQCEPLPYDSVTQTIGPLGGVIQVGPHSLTIPAGALDSDVTITAVTPSDTVNRIQFQPEGLVFNQYTDLLMSYANCNLMGSLLPKRIAYTTPDLLILDYLPSLDNVFTQTVRGKLQHFSDYALAW